MSDFLSPLSALFSKLRLDTLNSLLDSGGPVVAILLLLSLFVSATILIKLWQFMRMGIGGIGGIGGRNRSEKAIQFWLSGQRAQALDLLSDGKTPVQLVLAHAMRGLLNYPDEEERVREDVERVALQQMTRLRAYLRAIEAIVQVAPLLGLFGTVLGMIGAFRALQSAGAEADPAILAGGIWVALLTTAVGLAIAIPAALVLYWFEGIVERQQQAMEAALTSILTHRLTDDRAPALNEYEQELSHAT